MSAFKGPAKLLAGSGAAAFVVGSIGFGAYNSLFTVEAGRRAVLFNRLVGVRESIYAEGMHFNVPWLEWPTIYDIRTQPYTLSSSTGTRDMQTVQLQLRLLFKPDENSLPEIHRRFGEGYANRILPSIVYEVLKSVVAQYNASQLITQREDISKKIRENLEDRARDFYINVDDVSITHLEFGAEYRNAVENKQIAQQEAERAKYQVLQAKQDKKSNIIKAQGEAKSAQMIGASLQKNPGFIELRRLEAAREIAATVAKSQNKIFLNADSLLLNLGTGKPSFSPAVENN